MLAMNVVSTLAAGFGIILLSVSIINPRYYYTCDPYSSIRNMTPEMCDEIITIPEKAFDKVPHQRLLSKLRSHGVKGQVLLWIENWLINRKQRIQMQYISAILLAFTILEFLITITTAAFGCASMCRNAYSETFGFSSETLWSCSSAAKSRWLPTPKCGARKDTSSDQRVLPPEEEAFSVRARYLH